MKTIYQVLFMVAAFAIVVGVTAVVVMLMNSSARMKTKLEGMWINESNSIRILFHDIDSVFQGNIIWVNEIQQSQILGFNLIRGLMMKSFGQRSTGIYVDPVTRSESPFQLWFQGEGQMKMVLLDKVNGRHEVLREEKWFRL